MDLGKVGCCWSYFDLIIFFNFDWLFLWFEWFWWFVVICLIILLFGFDRINGCFLDMWELIFDMLIDTLLNDIERIIKINIKMLFFMILY